MPDDLTEMKERWINNVYKRKDMVKNDIKETISKILNIDAANLDKELEITDSDWSNIMYHYDRARSQIDQEKEYMAILAALKRHSEDLFNKNVNSKLCVDNFEHAFESYIRENW